MRSGVVRSFGVLIACIVAAGAAAQTSDFVSFESGQVRPIALTPDGSRLLVVNTPDAMLEVFDVGGPGLLTHAASVPVGLEPVAVAARNDSAAWVVNFLSDSVSVVRLDGPAPRVVRTLLVGDEPSDIVFAGPGDSRAFVTTAHRGQHFDRVHSLAGSPACDTLGDAGCFAGGDCACSESGTGGVGRADVWVFDADASGASLGGDPLTIISLFGDKPRALARSNDGSRVYAAILHSGNQTTVINEGLVCDTSGARMASDGLQPACSINGAASAGGYPPPHQNAGPGAPGSLPDRDRPETGLILKLNRDGGVSDTWQDEMSVCSGGPDGGDACEQDTDCSGGGNTCEPRDWSDVVKFDLPDRDVFEIDANASPPAAVDGDSDCVPGAGCWPHVGTVLFNMTVNPATGTLYVANTDAQNHVRFEGPGTHAAGKKPVGEPLTVQGNLAQARITVIANDSASVIPRHLNTHIDYSVRPAPAGILTDSLATPMGMRVTPDGQTLYVAAFGSNKIGVFDTTELEQGTFTPDSGSHIPLAGGGPSGLELRGNLLYVLTRFDNTLRVLSRVTSAELQALPLHNPEPAEIVAGRPFLYDATLTSSNGEASCSSCHIFGDLDALGWDLGNPDDDVFPDGNPFNPIVPPPGDLLPHDFHPSKGPMSTQSLRGLSTMGPQHWRGDRQGDGNAVITENDAVLAFEAFNVAFPGLVGRAAQLDPADMTAFREFALQLRYPPNPNRRLDNSLRPDEQDGSDLFIGRVTDIIANCDGCHTLDPLSGHFGGDGRTVFDGTTQNLKVPHLRNMYQKVGMFGMAEPISPFTAFNGDFTHQGDQIRGFGFTHDGSVDSLARFMGLGGFSMNATEEREMEVYMLSFESDVAPVVGQQITLTAANDSAVIGRIDLLEQRAGTSFDSAVLGGTVVECDLVAHVGEGGRVVGYLFDPAGPDWQPDDGAAPIDSAALRAKAAIPEQAVTFTCVPPGSGHRAALDRDRDTLWNGVETDDGIFMGPGATGSDPASADTDGDGFDDGIEVAEGTDPNDPISFPGAPPPLPPQQVPSLTPPLLGSLAVLLLLSGALAALRRRSR